MDARRWTSNTGSSSSSVGLLLVCVSLFLWLLIDTFIAVIPPSELKINNKFRLSPGLTDAYPGSDNSHLWWIIQISDLHISSYRNFHIPDDLKLFLTEVVPTIKPLAVLATGDLTDGKKFNVLHSGQELSEWQQYQDILVKNLDKQFTWIDMRGNHDKFDVASHSDDLFSKFSPFSKRWKPNDRHIVHKFSVNETSYAIVATDATPHPGFRRPYNFFGVLSENDLNSFQATDAELDKEGVQLAIWSGHYTTATVFAGGTFSSERRLLGEVIKHGAVYLCGHLHTLHDAERALYARHATLGQLELELADFQLSKRFRILAVDHGLLSFTDVSLRQWPVVLVVNPKEALYALPNYEPLEKIAKSTHIRIIAFSTAPIVQVQVTVNGRFLGNATRNPVLDSLYTLPWSPRELTSKTSNQFHRLGVTVIDAERRTTSEEVTFFIEPKIASSLPSNIGGPFASLLLLNIAKICRNALIVSSLFCIISLMVARFHQNLFVKLVPIAKTHLHGFVSFAKAPRLLYLTVSFVIAYPIFGPWFLGEVMTNRYALIFAHGILLIDDGTFVPCAVVAFHGFINVITFYLPLLFYFSWLFASSPATRSKSCRIVQRLLLQVIVLWQLWGAYLDAQAYGWLAFIFNPLRTWSSLAIIYVDIQARKIIGRC